MPCYRMGSNCLSNFDKPLFVIISLFHIFYHVVLSQGVFCMLYSCNSHSSLLHSRFSTIIPYHTAFKSEISDLRDPSLGYTMYLILGLHPILPSLAHQYYPWLSANTTLWLCPSINVIEDKYCDLSIFTSSRGSVAGISSPG